MTYKGMTKFFEPYPRSILLDKTRIWLLNDISREYKSSVRPSVATRPSVSAFYPNPLFGRQHVLWALEFPSGNISSPVSKKHTVSQKSQSIDIKSITQIIDIKSITQMWDTTIVGKNYSMGQVL
jgi:hypothetical protein